MSNKEKLLAYAEEMTETDLIFIVNVIEAYKAAEQKRREAEEIAECKRIFEECENNDDEPMPLDDYVAQLKTKWSDKDDADRVQDNH